MPVTHEQKADIGTRYLDAIKKRIETRTAANAKASIERMEGKKGSDALRKIGAVMAKRHRIPGEVTGVEVVDDYCYTRTHGGSGFRVTAGAAELTLLLRDVPGAADLIHRARKATNLANELCHEIKFLHEQLQPTRIACFQAHAARMWAPASKDDVIPAPRLAELIEDFLTGARPAVCKVA